jgi:hypothetical protein
MSQADVKGALANEVRSVLAVYVTAFAEATPERCHKVCSGNGPRGAEVPNHWHLRLLRTRGERPRCRAAEGKDELPPPHSIISSARASNCGGTSMPSALAVFKFMTNSNLVDCKTGKSAGLVPLRICPV